MKKREVFFKQVENYPKFKMSRDTSLSDLELLDDGMYRLDSLPPIDLISKFPYFYNSLGEIGLFCIEGCWLMTISKDEGITNIPLEINGYLRNGVAQFHAHSHPSEGSLMATGTPSVDDLLCCNAIDGLIYIIHDKGISEVNVSSIRDVDLKLVWADFILNEKKLTEDEFNNSDVYSLENELYDRIGLKRRFISFDNKKEIQDLLLSKMSLSDNFWERESEKVSFPGKSL